MTDCNFFFTPETRAITIARFFTGIMIILLVFDVPDSLRGMHTIEVRIALLAQRLDHNQIQFEIRDYVPHFRGRSW